jgi:hypothetical protein
LRSQQRDGLTFLLSHNAEAFLAPAIRSILEQTFSDFELIIVNDGSHDSSGAIIAGFAATDSRIVSVDQENAGIAETLNRAIALARSPLLARMDADDIALPRRFELQHRAFARRPELAALGSLARVIDEAGRIIGASYAPIGQRQIAKAALTYCPLTHPSVMMRRQPLEHVGRYRTHYEAAEDYDLWLRLLDAGYALDNLNHMLLDYREHVGGTSSSRRARQELCTLLARSASLMRQQGLSDAVLEESAVDEAALRRLPPSFRPCEAQILKAVHGPATALDSEQLQQMLRRLTDSETGQVCRRESATLRLRCGLVLLARGCFGAGLAAIGTALRADSLVIFRQLLRSANMRSVRVVRRLRYFHACWYGARRIEKRT